MEAEEGWEGGLKYSRYKGQRRTVMLLRQPQTPFLSLSAFCFSCQENWQAVGMKKADQVEQAPNSEAMLRL